MASYFKFTRGSKEIVPVTVVDKTNVTTDLSGASPKFWLRDPDGTTYIYDNVATTASGMLVSPLVDSSSGGPSGLLAEGDYDLWVGWTTGSEIVKKYVGKLMIRDIF